MGEDGINVYDVRTALTDTFKGCHVDVISTLGDSTHLEASFNDYEIRVILSGHRKIHYRFLQRIVPAKQKRAQRILIYETHTEKVEELLSAIRETKEYLLGVVHAIDTALKRKIVRPPTVSDFLGGS